MCPVSAMVWRRAREEGEGRLGSPQDAAGGRGAAEGRTKLAWLLESVQSLSVVVPS